MELKKLVIAAIAVLVIVAIVVIATRAYKTDDSSAPVNSIQPGPPVATPEPTPDIPVIPTPEPAPTIEATPGPANSKEGPFYMHASLNRTDGKCLVSLQIPKGAEPVDVKGLYADLVCENLIYDKAWTLKSMDWCNADNDTMLEKEEIIATIIDTAASEVPLGRPVTITLYKEGVMLQALTVQPS